MGLPRNIPGLLLFSVLTLVGHSAAARTLLVLGINRDGQPWEAVRRMVYERLRLIAPSDVTVTLGRHADLSCRENACLTAIGRREGAAAILIGDVTGRDATVSFSLFDVESQQVVSDEQSCTGCEEPKVVALAASVAGSLTDRRPVADHAAGVGPTSPSRIENRQPQPGHARAHWSSARAGVAGLLGGLLVGSLSASITLAALDGRCSEAVVPCQSTNTKALQVAHFAPLYGPGFALSGALAVGLVLIFVIPEKQVGYKP